ncbi:MAG: alternative ribosome rescue aminoacyl-tRNA hydrolase ArfB [Flavobacteriaceae bacterium]
MKTDQILKEVSFKAVRSGGSGGQHVNKVSTKVILVFDLMRSTALKQEEKERLLSTLAHRLTRDNYLIVQAADTRSQTKNREIAQQRLLNLLSSNLQVAKKRKRTKPTKTSKEKRLKSKKQLSAKKTSRKKPKLD